MSRLTELINLAASQVGFGKLTMNLEVHDGQVRALQGSEHLEKHFAGDGYSQAMEQVQLIMAQERTEGKSSQITFTLDNKNGQTKKLFIHRQFKHLLTDNQ